MRFRMGSWCSDCRPSAISSTCVALLSPCFWLCTSPCDDLAHPQLLRRAMTGSAQALDPSVALGAGLGARGRKDTLSSRGTSCTAGI